MMYMHTWNGDATEAVLQVDHVSFACLRICNVYTRRDASMSQWDGWKVDMATMDDDDDRGMRAYEGRGSRDSRARHGPWMWAGHPWRDGRDVMKQRAADSEMMSRAEK